MITSPATVVNIATGGGTDTVNIGTSVGPASTLFATFNITNPDQSGDILLVDDSTSFLTGTISILTFDPDPVLQRQYHHRHTV